jgi:chromosome segregation ATPase
MSPTLPSPIKKGLFAKFCQSPPTPKPSPSSTNAGPTPSSREITASADILQENTALLPKTSTLEKQLEEAKTISDINRSMLDKCSDDLVAKIAECEKLQEGSKEKDREIEQLEATNTLYEEALEEKDLELAALRSEHVKLVSRVGFVEGVLKKNREMIEVLMGQVRGTIARQISKGKVIEALDREA